MQLLLAAFLFATPPPLCCRCRRSLQPSTSTSSSKDWMFCPISGYLLELDPVRGVAHCPMTGYHKSLDGGLLTAGVYLGALR